MKINNLQSIDFSLNERSPIYASAANGCKTYLNIVINKIQFYRIKGYTLISMLIKKIIFTEINWLRRCGIYMVKNGKDMGKW
jgi:hypothetical protein